MNPGHRNTLLLVTSNPVPLMVIVPLPESADSQLDDPLLTQFVVELPPAGAAEESPRIEADAADH